MLAEDIVLRHNLGELVAANNQYLKDIPVAWFDDEQTPPAETPLHAVVPFLAMHCHPCMLGNFFLSYARCFNRLKFWDFAEKRMRNNQSGEPERIVFSNIDRFEEVLKTVFPPDQIELIEAAFEGQSYLIKNASMASVNSPEYRRYRDAIEFGRPHRVHPALCAYMIAKNIVFNGGVFDPSCDEGDDSAEIASDES